MTIEAAQLVRIVEDDVEQVMRSRLAPDVENGGFALAEPATFTNELAIQDPEGTVSVVVWEWRGIDAGIFNDPGADEQRFSPSGEEVTVRGVTLVTESEDGPLLHRYIDWLDVWSQVGITVSPRPIVDVRNVWTPEELEEVERLR